jgi:hypothetical protein
MSGILLQGSLDAAGDTSAPADPCGMVDEYRNKDRTIETQRALRLS